MLPKSQIFVFDHMISDEMCDKVISLFQEVPLREEKYGKKPMVYTGNYFYWMYLAGYIDDYPHWISCWTGGELSLINIEWDFRQFTQEGKINGIKTNVDGNYYKGELIDLKAELL